MFLKELNLGHEAKCTCESCKGTGLNKGWSERDDLAIICYNCNGKGYFTLKLDESIQLVQDEKMGVIYEVNDGIVVGSVCLFDKLQKRDDVNYVVYGTGKTLSPKYLFEHGATKNNVISYEEFVEGKLPLPMMQMTCPKQISRWYGNGEFKNNCGIGGDASDCEKFETHGCWDKFYGEAKTVEEKQKVLRKLR